MNFISLESIYRGCDNLISNKCVDFFIKASSDILPEFLNIKHISVSKVVNVFKPELLVRRIDQQQLNSSHKLMRQIECGALLELIFGTKLKTQEKYLREPQKIFWCILHFYNADSFEQCPI